MGSITLKFEVSDYFGTRISKRNERIVAKTFIEMIQERITNEPLPSKTLIPFFDSEINED